MPISFKELPTTFYLGRHYNGDTHQMDDEVIYYDSNLLSEFSSWSDSFRPYDHVNLGRQPNSVVQM